MNASDTLDAIHQLKKDMKTAVAEQMNQSPLTFSAADKQLVSDALDDLLADLLGSAQREAEENLPKYDPRAEHGTYWGKP